MNDSIRLHDENLFPIWSKVQKGERLGLDDGIHMFESHDLIGLGKMANAVQARRSGDAVYYVLNQKIEPSNVCVLSCKFCDFATKSGRPDAYEMTIREILDKLTPEIHEVHITGGLHPDWSWNFYLDMLREIRKKFPNVSIKAFTAVEIDFFRKKFKLPLDEVLQQLKEAGLETMPGGGAEVFSERVRKLLFNQKIGAKTWFEVHAAAHRRGIPSNCTILYGHVETIRERVQHLLRLRDAQDETGGFLSFIPLAFQPGDTGIKPREHFTSAIDDLKMIAVSRLMLDNIPHIKAYWVMLTEEVASVALNFGADDLDGTVGGERIAHDAGAVSASALTKDRLVRMIRDAGKVAVERDVYYNPIGLTGEHIVARIPYLNSLPFYEKLDKRQFKVVPITPRRMGLLASEGRIDAGIFSLVDFLRQRQSLEPLGFCIATRDQVKSVILFSNYGWKDLDGKKIGIMDDTATSVQLLKVLLRKKHNVTATFVRMHAGVNDFRDFDAVLLIGDAALHHRKYGLTGFELSYDLATEWYEWQQLPFVFAVWAVRKELEREQQDELREMIAHALAEAENDFTKVGVDVAARIGLTSEDSCQYLQAFIYRVGDREKLAISRFEQLVIGIAPQFAQHHGKTT